MKKVLLVEDSDFQAAKTQLDLEGRGFSVKVAYNAEGAFRVVESWQPDVIIIDYVLPDMNGVEICRRLKQNLRYKNIPVILFSSVSKLHYMVEAYDAGADSYIVKGHGGENVLELLVENIFHRQQRRQLPLAKAV